MERESVICDMLPPLKEVGASCSIVPMHEVSTGQPRMSCGFHEWHIIRTLDILRIEGAWFSHIISLCNLIYPVVNVHAISASIT